MLESTTNFVTNFFKQQTGFKNLLDVGSLDFNGTIRNSIPKEIEYVGVDMQKGNNVDVVINAHNLLDKFEPESFDIVTCFDTLEHDDKFWLTWENIKKVVRKGGWVLLGVPGRNCPSHYNPRDYYRFMPDIIDDYFFKDFVDVHKVITVLGDREELLKNPDDIIENELYGWGRKPL